VKTQALQLKIKTKNNTEAAVLGGTNLLHDGVLTRYSHENKILTSSCDFTSLHSEEK
jgi:hypothetical protein